MLIFCVFSAAALVKMKLLVDEQHLHVLDLDVPRKINGVLVTALDANQYVFLFKACFCVILTVCI
jgi:hypothetical protein